MKNGDFIYARTHAEFLNEAFGTNYKGYMKCVWQYGDKTVWMVRFNSVNGGWGNTFISENRIQEENVARMITFNGKSVSYVDPIKIVIEIDGWGENRRYIFRGVYKYDEESSDPYTVRYYNKISDEF